MFTPASLLRRQPASSGRSTTRFPSQRHVRWFTLAILGLAGCAAPKAQINAPLISLPTRSHPTTELADSPRRSSSATTRDRIARRAATRVTRAAPLESHTRLPSDLDRNVARYIAQPSRLFTPSTPIRPWQYIVLHHSAGESGSLDSIDRYHREVKGWDECGYHFVIGNGTESGDGEIEVGGRWLMQKHGAHCKDPAHPEYNQDGIGICLVGNLNNGPPTTKQIEACRRLVSYLSSRCNVPRGNITTHGDLVGNHTECPGKHFPYERLIPNRNFASRD